MTRRRTQATFAALLIVGALLSGCSAPTTTAESAAPADLAPIDALETRALGAPELVVVAPLDGASVTSPVTVEIRVDNYRLAAKGVSRDGEGHFHVIEGECITPGEVISDDHAHVGSGAAVTEVELEPGPRRLCVQLGDGFHTALAITQTIDVVVAE